MRQYEIRAYQTEKGDVPFSDWISGLKDPKAKTVVTARVLRAEAGNFGDWKSISGAPGLCEMRIHYGQGFRIFYSIIGQAVVLLLVGSAKQDQDKTIEKAKTYLSQYNQGIKK